MLKERQLEKLESYGFKQNGNNEYEIKFKSLNASIICSIPHQVWAYYYDGEAALLYDFFHLLDVLDLLDINDLVQ